MYTLEKKLPSYFESVVATYVLGLDEVLCTCILGVSSYEGIADAGLLARIRDGVMRGICFPV